MHHIALGSLCYWARFRDRWRSFS